MATGTVQSTTLPPAAGESIERERVIQRQLKRASLQMRLVDLASGMAVWVIGVLVLFIAAALFDHLLGLGTVGRFLALTLLVGGSLWYLAMHVVPLLVRTINPAYAARTIEEATPTLKNSLINFLLLRQDKSGIREIVYQAVEKQAAADIVRVPVETTIDRTRLIYAGYCLCSVMAIFAAYKILSPKDPFQTVARVLAPWATIARPSRVQIIEIQPGNGEVYYGQTAQVSATIRGLRGTDSVKLHYSTADGQAIDQPIPMKLAAGDRYECTLPPGERSGPAAVQGLQQNVAYRVIAGDAESSEYRLIVVSAPTIIIDRLEYQYPAYTKKPPEVVRQQGDIKAIEGTKVTLHAVANQPIKSAWLEMDPAAKEAAAELVTLSADGDQARGTLTLLLKADRLTPWHATYQVRYHNQRSEKSQQPILHKIEVIRDLPPEVQILQPERLRVEVPEDGELTIEVRAVDPDFGLASLRIEATVAGKPPVNIDLLSDPASHPPQATVPYVFRPREHNLKAGDELTYAAVAEDNRASPQTGQTEPNVARTNEYKLVITAAQKKEGSSGKAPQAGGNEKNPAQTNPPPQPGDKQPPAGQQRNQEQNKDNEEPNKRPNEKPQPPMNADDRQGQQEQRGDKTAQQKGQQDKQQKGEGQQQSGQGQQEKQPGGQQSNDKQPEGGQQQSGQAGDKQQGTGQQQSGEQQSGQSGQEGGGGSKQPSNQPGGEQSGESGSDGTASGKPGRGQEQQQQPGGGDGQGKAEHDGQAIERIFKDLQQRDQQNKGGQPGEGGKSQQGQGEQTPMPGDKSGEQSQSAPQDSGTKKGEAAGSEQGGQPQAGGKSGGQNANQPNAGKPEGNDQKSTADGTQQKAKSKAGDPKDRLPDEKQGQNPSEQQSGGNKGGAPQGPSKTDKGEKSTASKGEDREAGAGKTGDEGAGQASDDKIGSGPGTRKNADQKKELQPDSNKAEKGEPSPASSSNRQSDSKGGESGQESGGGKKGAGQSAGQEGNDGAGSKSAADQGAGKANETGGGETGSKAGQQQQASGKTGQSGSERGEGSAKRAGDERSGESQGQQPGEGDAGGKSPKTARQREPQDGGTTGSDPVGGKDGGRERTPPPATSSEEQAADAANLEYAKKATEMVLRKLKEEEHNPDPELLDKLGWTRDDLAEFLRRWEALQKSAGETPTGKRELDEALKSLGLRDPANRRRAGGTTSDKQRDLRDAGNRSAAPPRYRELFDAFRKGAARSSP